MCYKKELPPLSKGKVNGNRVTTSEFSREGKVIAEQILRFITENKSKTAGQ